MKRRVERLEAGMKREANVAYGVGTIGMSEEDCREALSDQLQAKFGGQDYQVDIGQGANIERLELVFACSSSELDDALHRAARSDRRIGIDTFPSGRGGEAA